MHDKNHEEAAAILAIQLTPGMGYKRVNRLLACVARRDPPLGALFETDCGRLCRRFPALDSVVAARLTTATPAFRAVAEEHIRNALRRDIQPLTILDGAYPQTFKHCLGDAAPPLVFVRGNQELLPGYSGAVVGTRAPSPRGAAAARKAAESIVAHARVLTSGGAQGVDWAAHDAALAVSGATIIVLPQGILSYQLPLKWRSAYENGSVVLLSESLPDAPWQKHAAVARNALISALAQVVCVVEPRKQGGSVLTLRHALKQNKPVFVAQASLLPPELRTRTAPLRQLDDQIACLDWAAIQARQAVTTQNELL